MHVLKHRIWTKLAVLTTGAVATVTPWPGCHPNDFWLWFH